MTTDGSLDLTALRAALAHVHTPLPWQISADDTVQIVDRFGGAVLTLQPEDEESYASIELAGADRDYIIAAANAAPGLVTERDELVKRIAELDAAAGRLIYDRDYWHEQFRLEREKVTALEDVATAARGVLERLGEYGDVSAGAESALLTALQRLEKARCQS